MREEISEWEVDSIKPVSNQFKTTFYPPAIMERPFCRTTSEWEGDSLNNFQQISWSTSSGLQNFLKDQSNEQNCWLKNSANANFSASKQNDIAQHIGGAISVNNYTIFQESKFLY